MADEVRIFWATVFKPFWLVEAFFVAWKYFPNFRDAWLTADSLWDIALEDLDYVDRLMSPREALMIEMEYWD